jgi:hypothetical protein
MRLVNSTPYPAEFISASGLLGTTNHNLIACGEAPVELPTFSAPRGTTTVARSIQLYSEGLPEWHHQNDGVPFFVAQQFMSSYGNSQYDLTFHFAGHGKLASPLLDVHVLHTTAHVVGDRLSLDVPLELSWSQLSSSRSLVVGVGPFEAPKPSLSRLRVAHRRPIAVVWQRNFSPSKELTDFWVRGVLASVEAVSLSTPVLPSDAEVQQEFAKMLTSLLGTTAQQLRYREYKNVSITHDHKFLVRYQNQICDLFFITMYEAADFLKLLCAELIAALSEGARVEGGWGTIALDASGDLFYRLKPPNTSSDPSFIPSEAVE